MLPTRVRLSPSSRCSRRAIPKSTSLTSGCPSRSRTKTFAGFKSRCTTPFECAVPSAGTAEARSAAAAPDPMAAREPSPATRHRGAPAGCSAASPRTARWEDLHHVLVAHHVGGARLALEAADDLLVVVELGPQHLHRRDRLSHLVLSEEHLARAAAAQQARHPVVAEPIAQPQRRHLARSEPPHPRLLGGDPRRAARSGGPSAFGARHGPTAYADESGLRNTITPRFAFGFRSCS